MYFFELNRSSKNEKLFIKIKTFYFNKKANKTFYFKKVFNLKKSLP